jgi:predicted metal-dependent hydrolase
MRGSRSRCSGTADGLLAKTPGQLDREIADYQERTRLARRVQRLLDKWQPILGVHLGEFHIKKMRAFASTNVRDSRLWVGQALADMSPADLEYVIVHELVHLRVGDIARDEGTDPEAGSGHDARFYTLMDQYLPTWRRRHARLRSSAGVVAGKLPGA